MSVCLNVQLRALSLSLFLLLALSQATLSIQHQTNGA